MKRTDRAWLAPAPDQLDLMDDLMDDLNTL